MVKKSNIQAMIQPMLELNGLRLGNWLFNAETGQNFQVTSIQDDIHSGHVNDLAYIQHIPLSPK